MNKTPILKNRIRELRKARGLTLDRLADLTELSTSYLNRLESGQRNLSTKHMPQIAKALGVLPADLIDLSKAWLEIDITGIIKDDHEIILIGAGNANLRRMSADVPSALGEVSTAIVVGNALSPRYGDGDVITWKTYEHEISSLVGKECVVLLTNQRIYLKTIAPGSRPGVFHLTSFNAPAVFDAEIVKASPVGWVERA